MGVLKSAERLFPLISAAKGGVTKRNEMTFTYALDSRVKSP